MKKRIFLVAFLMLSLVSVFASATTLVPYKKADGGSLYYRGTNLEVMIPEEYIEQESDFRAVWVTHLVGDFPSYSNESQYKAEVDKVFETMEYYNLNAMIFHVRTHNNALYKSSLNPVANYYSRANFDVFDPLEYIITEAHARGIEFHAWMNPYRLSTSYTGTVEAYASTQPSYNIASNPEMILKAGNSLILNPGEPAVRNFIVDTVMEFLENYEADAIHFDDYFYISGVDDSHTRAKYGYSGDLGDFRRTQVDLFIEQLYGEMKAFNLANNRVVQLGISPSGIYQNGGHVPLEDYKYNAEGVLTYPLYSNTSGFSHYGNYLYSDTKKWIDEGWIDYIIPQVYWSFEQPVAGFAPIMDWWNAAVKYSDVNLYVGMGLYMSASGTSGNYGWNTNVDEALNQVKYASNLENVHGFSVYSYKHMSPGYSNPNRDIQARGINKVKNEAWHSVALLPEVRTYDRVILPGVTNLSVANNGGNKVINFKGLEDAKYYVVYRDTDNIDFSTSQIIDVFGSKDDVVEYVDETAGDYVYGIKAMSNTNTLGVGKTASVDGEFYYVDFYIDDVLVSSLKTNEEIIAPELPTKYGYDQVSPVWNITDFSNITSNTRVDAVYTINKYTVTFVDYFNDVLEVIEVNHGETVTPPVLEDREGYRFLSWDYIDRPITSNFLFIPNFEVETYTVTFYDGDTVLKSVEVNHGTAADAPTPPAKEGYEFKEWDVEFDEVTGDLEVNAIYEESKNPSIFSCKEVNYTFMVFALGFALFMFIRRKK